jgi:hypothetical protein
MFSCPSSAQDSFCKYRGAFTICSVSNPEYCLEIMDGTRQRATPVVLRKKSGNDRQLWKYDTSTQVILSVLDPTFVLDIRGDPVIATDVIIWPRHNGQTQKWLISTDGVIQNVASRKVLESMVDRREAVVLNKLMAYNSPELVKQQWQVFPYPDPSIRDGAFYLISEADPTMVLTLSGGKSGNGVQIVVSERKIWAPESDQQLFFYDPIVKSIKSQLDPRKVLDIAGGISGSALQIWDLTGGENQRFEIMKDGRIKCAFSDQAITFIERNAPVKLNKLNAGDIRQVFRKVYYQDPTQDAFFIQWADDPRAVIHVEGRQSGARITAAFKMSFYQQNQLFRYEKATRHIVSVLEPRKCLGIFGGVQGTDLVLWPDESLPNLQWELLPWGGIKPVYTNTYVTFQGIGNQLRLETGHPEKPQRWLTIPLKMDSNAPKIGLDHLQQMISDQVQQASGHLSTEGQLLNLGASIGAPCGILGSVPGPAGGCSAPHPYNPQAGIIPNPLLPQANIGFGPGLGVNSYDNSGSMSPYSLQNSGAPIKAPKPLDAYAKGCLVT